MSFFPIILFTLIFSPKETTKAPQRTVLIQSTVLYVVWVPSRYDILFIGQVKERAGGKSEERLGREEAKEKGPDDGTIYRRLGSRYVF